MIAALATFLRNFCNCDVRLDMWCTTEIGVKRFWLYNEISEANKVLIIFSNGTLSKWKAASKNKAEEAGLSGEFGDMFLRGYQIASQEFDGNTELLAKKYVAAYFEYSKKEHVLPDFGDAAKYAIPKHLEALYFKLHNIPQHTPLYSETAFGLCPESYHLVSKEGEALHSAIEKMKLTVRNVPDWYENSEKSAKRISDDGYVSNSHSPTEDVAAPPDFFPNPTNSEISESGSLTYSDCYDELHEHPTLKTRETPGDIEGTEFGPNVPILEPYEGCLNSGISNFDEANLITGSTAVESFQYYNLHTLDSEDIQLHSQSLGEMANESGAYTHDYYIHGNDSNFGEDNQNNNCSNA